MDVMPNNRVKSLTLGTVIFITIPTSEKLIIERRIKRTDVIISSAQTSQEAANRTFD